MYFAPPIDYDKHNATCLWEITYSRYNKGIPYKNKMVPILQSQLQLEFLFR